MTANSPYTGKPMSLQVTQEAIPYKGASYTVDYESWLCADTGQTFTTDELDERNVEKVKRAAAMNEKNKAPDGIDPTLVTGLADIMRQQAHVSADKFIVDGYRFEVLSDGWICLGEIPAEPFFFMKD